MSEIRERLERIEQKISHAKGVIGDALAVAQLLLEKLPSIAQQPQPICRFCNGTGWRFYGSPTAQDYNERAARCPCGTVPEGLRASAPVQEEKCPTCGSKRRDYLKCVTHTVEHNAENLACPEKPCVLCTDPWHTSGISEQKVAQPTISKFYRDYEGDKDFNFLASTFRFALEFAAEQTASLRSQLKRADKWNKYVHDEAKKLRDSTGAPTSDSHTIDHLLVIGYQIDKIRKKLEAAESALRSRESVAIDYEALANEIVTHAVDHTKSTRNVIGEISVRLKNLTEQVIRSHDQKLRGWQSQQEDEPTVGEVLREFEKFDTLTSKAAKLVYFRNLVEKHVRLRGRQSVTPQPQTESPKEKR